MIIIWFGLVIILILAAMFGWYLDSVCCKNCGQPLFYSEHEKKYCCVHCGWEEKA